MASTPIYNWPTPDNTDLVKNGALAIRTLGDAIDTTVDTMIPETIFAAKGDLLGASANDTPAILSVGANGETLVADSAATTGLRYSATPSASNPVINSAMQNWQRGTTFAVTNGSLTFYTADRWQAHRGATGATVSRQTTSDTTNLAFIQYCSRVQRDNANAATNAIGFFQNFESVNSIPFAGKTVTMSFYARAGANYSHASSGLSVFLLSGTGTDQNAINGLTGSANVISQTATLTTTWQRFTYSATVGATATQIVPYFVFTPVGTAGAADYYEITGVQIDIGSVALPFRTYAATIQGELSACQRYYTRNTATGNASSVFGFGTAISTTQIDVPIKLPTTMRVFPSAVDFATLRITPDGNNSVIAVSSMTLVSTFLNQDIATVRAVVSGATQFRPYFLTASADVTAFVGFSAEL